MDWTLAGQFWIIAAALAVTPGPDWAYVIAAGARRQHPAPTVLGLLSGYVLVIAFVAVGAGALITAVPLALTVLTVAGGAFLVYLGLTTLLRPAVPIDVTGQPVTGSIAIGGASEVGLAGAGLSGDGLSGDGLSGGGVVQQFLRGAGVSGINPKGILLLLALLPQFTGDSGAWPQPIQMLALGGLHLFNCAIVYTAVALVSGRLLGGRPRAGAIVTRITGIMMMAVGFLLLVEELLPLL